MYEKYIRKVMQCDKHEAKLITKAIQQQIDEGDEFSNTFKTVRTLVYALKKAKQKEEEDMRKNERRIRWQIRAGILKVAPV